MAEHIRPFDPDGAETSQRWSRWLDRMNLFLRVKKITDESEKKDNLLYYAGEYVYEKYCPLKSQNDSYEDVVNKLSNVFIPPVNAQVSLYKFRNTSQQEEEPFDDFVTRLRFLAKQCGFEGDDLNTQLKNQIIQSCFSDNIRKRALEKDSITLKELVTLGRTLEAVDSHMKVIRQQDQIFGSRTNDEENINQMKLSKEPEERRQRSCWKCGGEYPHGSKGCPANGRKCNKCKQDGHLQNAAKQRKCPRQKKYK